MPNFADVSSFSLTQIACGLQDLAPSPSDTCPCPGRILHIQDRNGDKVKPDQPCYITHILVGDAAPSALVAAVNSAVPERWRRKRGISVVTEAWMAVSRCTCALSGSFAVSRTEQHRRWGQHCMT